jgi:hypothetical protein
VSAPQPPTVAALYVERGGVYWDLPGVDAWDEQRDAHLYAGPWPVVAHPPCARWSRLAGFTEARFGLKRGEDGGCFENALRAVREFGGVLEHPAYSAAWDRFNLPEPLVWEGWTGGLCGGFSAYVEQGRYGLPVKKATWLYAYGVELPDLRWGHTSDGEGVERGLENWRDRWGWWGDNRNSGTRSRTPTAFRDVLLAVARGRSVSGPQPSSAGKCAVCGRWVAKRYGGEGRYLPQCIDCWTRGR